MEELQTDTLSAYSKNADSIELNSTCEELTELNDPLNVSDEVDPLELMEHVDNVSFGSDVWRASDSEDDSLEKKSSQRSSNENNNPEPEAEADKPTPVAETPDPIEAPPVTSRPQTPEEPTGPPTDPQNNTEKPSNRDEFEDIENELPTSYIEKDLPTPVESAVDTPASENAPQSSAVEPPDPLCLNEPAEGDNSEEKNDTEAEPEDDFDDDDFDPSLLCPEVYMDVDDNPVLTNNDTPPDDDKSLSTFKDEATGVEITFNLTAEELELRKKQYGPGNPIEYTKVHCTACNVHLGSALSGQDNRYVHPLLKVLICKKCYNFYTSGEFEKDEDGSELYCRWCGQGGQVLCCSTCEFVFCKRCIRGNFGRKKMLEIRDSDNWQCFRCVPSQMILPRIACYEFFEYIRRETSRASTLNDPEFLNKDFTTCCDNNNKRPAENYQMDENKKAKKRKVEIDEDFNPMRPQKNMNKPPIILSVPKRILPISKPLILAKKRDNDIEFVQHIPPSQIVLNPVRMAGNMQGYRPIAPNRTMLMKPPALVRLAKPPKAIPSVTMTASNQGTRGNLPNGTQHDWFQKTARGAARVNSQLSFTLSQLNKAQSQAESVEELAMIHNKLQEVLSSSINSLIQIRKNLRAEFIDGIKTVRLPVKQHSFINDDDVIFVSDEPKMPMPSSSGNNSCSFVNNSSIVKPIGGYLKVKSVKDLQNVPSECITIPDDPPVADKEDCIIVCNGSDKTVSENEAVVTETVAKETTVILQDTTTVVTEKVKSPPTAEVVLIDSSDKLVNELSREDTTDREDIPTQDSSREVEANNTKKIDCYLNDYSTAELKKMFSVTVRVARVDLLQLQESLKRK